MAADYIVKIVRGADTFNLSGDFTPEKWGEEEVSNKIPSVELEGTEGEYQGDEYLGPRTVVLPFLIPGDDPDDRRDKFDALSMALIPGPASGEVKLYKHSDRYLQGRIAFLRLGEDLGLNYLECWMGLRAANPLWHDDNTSTLDLSAGSNAITAGGGYPALPIFTFVVSATGTISVSHAGTGQAFTLTLSATGTYVVDCGAGTVTKDGSTDAIAMFSGEFLDEGLVVAASTITLGGTATLSDADVDWRKRWVTN